MPAPTVLVVWRGNPEANSTQQEIRFPAIESALEKQGLRVRHLAFVEEELGIAQEMMLASDTVLVWVDPISGTRDRFALDNLLRDVAGSGVRVYAHPDTILRMGTKDVLFDTRELSWSVDTESYSAFEEFQRRFPLSLRAGPRVLKQHRGNGGIGVWKVEYCSTDTHDADPSYVRVQHAAPRDGSFEEIPFDQLLERMEPYFEGTNHVINQEFLPRVREGMVRAYLVKAVVVGFARQYAALDSGVAAHHVFGVPSAKTMLGPDTPEFARLRHQLETEWVPGLQRTVGISRNDLPLLWDADFLFGPKDALSHDSYKLCEINASCVSPFPELVPLRLAEVLVAELAL